MTTHNDNFHSDDNDKRSWAGWYWGLSIYVVILISLLYWLGKIF